MSKRRIQRAKTDANQGEIVQALRDMGAFVQTLHTVGKGCPDLLVSFRGVWYVLEVKDGNKPPSRRHLTPDEKDWHEKANAPVFIVKSVEDAINAVDGKYPPF